MSPRDILAEENPDALLVDDLDGAFVGVARRCGQPSLAVYDYDKAVEIFMERDDLTYEEAVEWMEYNVVGAWLGPGTPIWLQRPSVE